MGGCGWESSRIQRGVVAGMRWFWFGVGITYWIAGMLIVLGIYRPSFRVVAGIAFFGFAVAIGRSCSQPD